LSSTSRRYEGAQSYISISLVVIPIFTTLPLLHSQVDYVDFLTVFYSAFLFNGRSSVARGCGAIFIKY